MKIQTLTKQLLTMYIVLLSGSSTVFADVAAPTVTAAQLTAKATDTLSAASSFSADFTEIDTYPGQYRDLKQSGHLAFARPGKLELDIRRFRRVDASADWTASGNDTKSDSDGVTYWFSFLHPYSTQVKSSPATTSAIRSATAVIPPAALFFGESAGSGTLPEQDGPATLIATQQWEGAQYSVIQYPVAGRGADDLVGTAFVGTDNVIHRLIYTTDSPRGPITKEWQLSNIELSSPLPDSQFAYVAPVGSFPLDASVAGSLLAPGTVAPDFTVQDKDGHAVKLSDFRGKTVILDFWATWCWPCNQSLPHTEQVAESFASQNVVVLAVAIRDSKTGFEHWLTKHSYPSINFALDQKPEGQDIASTLYNVETTPTAFVIDQNGTIVQAVSGYTGPTKELASAITTALTHQPRLASSQ